MKEKNHDQMWTILKRKKEIDLDIERSRKYSVDLTLKKMKQAQELTQITMEENSRISKAINSQRQQETVKSREMLKLQRLQENSKTIRRAESEQKSIMERKDLMQQFNDTTRLYNFTKNQAKRDFTTQLVLAKKLNVKGRQKFLEQSSLMSQFGPSLTANQPSPAVANSDINQEGGGFFLTAQPQPNFQLQANRIPTK